MVGGSVRPSKGGWSGGGCDTKASASDLRFGKSAFLRLKNPRSDYHEVADLVSDLLRNRFTVRYQTCVAKVAYRLRVRHIGKVAHRFRVSDILRRWLTGFSVRRVEVI
jgi:hypothetical protein